jgi:predicted metal-dependent phosphoesterase TrpH
VWALCDHDTVAGLPEAAEAAGRLGKDVMVVGREAARQALETTGEVAKGAVESVKGGLRSAASLPREVAESAIKGDDKSS